MEEKHISEEKYEKAFRAMVDFEAAQHERNQRRIKAGIKCLFVIPVVFLVLMFLTSSSKPVFLILWIISLYGIGIYLIGVEYVDHKLQHQLAKFRGEEEIEAKPLIGQEIDAVEGVLRDAHAQAMHLLKRDETDEEHN